MEDGPRIVTKTGTKPGKTLAVFAGVHGNERVGVEVVEKLLSTIAVERGTVHFVFANTRAIQKNLRYIERNLNRCFSRDNVGTTYEDQVARVLMDLLDETDALLDVHASNTPDATPFVIYEDISEDCVRKLPFSLVSTGWVDVEPGATDEYMYRQGKPGICIECGYINASGDFHSIAEASILTFLAFYGAIDRELPADRSQKRVHVHTALIKEDDSFEYYRQYSDFEVLPKGTCYARDIKKEYCVSEDTVIIFATQKKVGDEVGILGRWVD